jgi:hypothetical protein
MFSARVWAHCHDELCDWKVSTELYQRLARRLRQTSAVTERGLQRLADEEQLGVPDAVAFPMLGLGVLYYDRGKLTVDPRWVPG